MRFRHSIEPVIDGLSEEDMARIRKAAAASVTPGLEGLVGPRPKTVTENPTVQRRTDYSPSREPLRSSDVLPGKRKGRRA